MHLYYMTRQGEQATFMKLRERVGLTQRQVADALGITVNTVSSWETGRNEPRLDFVQTKRLMEIYDCSIDELAESLNEIRQKKSAEQSS